MNTNINVFCPNKNSVAFRALCLVLRSSFTPVNSTSSADAVFVFGDMPEMYANYTEEGVFVYYATNALDNLALLRKENVVVVKASLSLTELCAVFQNELFPLVAGKKKAEPKKELIVPSDLVKTKGRYRVLVIDDKPENLELAKLLLSGHQLVTADGLKSGMGEFDVANFDAVLTDMEMRPDNFYQSYSVTSQPLGHHDLFGWAVAAEVTKRGVPVAIVTDGNHHTSWTVAMFNNMKKLEMNGQPVLLFGNIGKRWDKALKELLEPDLIEVVV